ncbi:MAG TPA: segregation/condensation protein A [Candidatus Dormibacteraeota bacterium]|nr:segregation/condensation protein A [Candidatus Dormibacteraeota bacterium]
MADERVTTPAGNPDASAADAAARFHVEVDGFSGSLEQLVVRAQRGEVELDGIALAEITGQYRRRMEAAGEQVDLREVADFLSLAARLVALKAARLNPSQAGEAVPDDEEVADDAGRRLSEYRLFKAAAEALLAEAAEEGTRSFLGLVAPEVIPVERLRIPPERLAAAFREVLLRLSEAEPLPVGAVIFSVAEKMAGLRDRLGSGPLAFDEVFAAVTTRLEAVACFLALLELLRLGEATVDQEEPFGPITVRAGG